MFRILIGALESYNTISDCMNWLKEFSTSTLPVLCCSLCFVLFVEESAYCRSYKTGSAPKTLVPGSDQIFLRHCPTEVWCGHFYWLYRWSTDVNLNAAAGSILSDGNPPIACWNFFAFTLLQTMHPSASLLAIHLLFRTHLIPCKVPSTSIWALLWYSWVDTRIVS